MKKFTSIAAILAGVAAIVWMVFTILNYGATNMRRVEAQAYEYRLHWTDRR